MNATETYNGWRNYETWNVKLWMDNEQSSAAHYAEMADEYLRRAMMPAVIADHPHWDADERAKFLLADALKEEYEERAEDLLEDTKQSASVWADLIGAALSEVDWEEIAVALLEDAKERASK